MMISDNLYKCTASAGHTGLISIHCPLLLSYEENHVTNLKCVGNAELPH